MDDNIYADAPPVVREELRIGSMSRSILGAILRNLWWSRNIPYRFSVDEQKLEADIQTYLRNAAF